MTAGVQCDTCRKFSPSTPVNWLYVVRPSGEPSILAALGVTRDEPGTFCSATCLAEWAYVQAMANGAPAGSEPPPASGIGWPG